MSHVTTALLCDLLLSSSLFDDELVELPPALFNTPLLDWNPYITFFFTVLLDIFSLFGDLRVPIVDLRPL